MFSKFTRRGPKIQPVNSQSMWRDTRPAPNSVVHGVYTPVLHVGEACKENRMCLPFFNPKKPRGTV
jgi:hypothetical protein